MKESDISISRLRAAVLTAARLLYAARVPNYPVDEGRLLSAFSRRVFLMPYSRLNQDALAWAKSKSPDGFCLQISRAVTCGRADASATSYPAEGNIGTFDDCIWQIYYEDRADKARKRFTLMHELGHVLLKHHSPENSEACGAEGARCPDRRADNEADEFAASVLAPAPAVERLLSLHGFTLKNGQVAFTCPDAPLLNNLGQTPRAVPLISTAFGISVSAAERRIRALAGELEMWKSADRALFDYAQSLPHRADWYCWVCGTKRRSAYLYCPGCGKGGDYVYSDPGRFARGVMGLRDTGRFEFCSVCGSDGFSDDASYCGVCGAPLVNPCENARHTPGDFIRSGMKVVSGTHLCRPTDIYCPHCGVLTLFGARHGPTEGLWLKDRCRTKRAAYGDPDSEKALPDSNINTCGEHACKKGDRYCEVCGKKTKLFEQGALEPYTQTRAFSELIESEKYRPAPPPPLLNVDLTRESGQRPE